MKHRRSKTQKGTKKIPKDSHSASFKADKADKKVSEKVRSATNLG